MSEHKKEAIFSFAGLVAVIFYVLTPESQGQEMNTVKKEAVEIEVEEQPVQKMEEKVPNEKEQALQTLMVDVKGAVVHPGVFQATSEERVKDLVNRAGGLTETADPNQVNFAAHIEDEMVIYVPKIGEEKIQIADSSTGSKQEDSPDKINLNQANETELQMIPGVGPAKAKAIIEYRESTGFKTIDDIKNISGIGDKTFEKLKDFITVK
ncbi:helix-hairpin-helix domain-containing protein [Bacillus sp. cl95]|uniref:helix-hairpin-helix domain-containing protein n=1 Tax=Bacillus sp. cl95 TaxID=1761761 RepID=UPI001C31CFB0|nr:helix-hairpin-helix domain-containing protein [Bacillus sp. cl95]